MPVRTARIFHGEKMNVSYNRAADYSSIWPVERLSICDGDAVCVQASALSIYNNAAVIILHGQGRSSFPAEAPCVYTSHISFSFVVFFERASHFLSFPYHHTSGLSFLFLKLFDTAHLM